MNRIIGVALLVIGIVLLCIGYNSYHSAASDVSRVVSGASTNKTLWLIIGGLFSTLVGLGGLFIGSKRA